MEYFSKDDVLNLLNRNSITKKITLADGVSIYDSVKNLPTADVIEVVRCKDCVSYIPNHRGGKCALHSDYYGEHEVEMEADDYCSCGRREW